MKPASATLFSFFLAMFANAYATETLPNAANPVSVDLHSTIDATSVNDPDAGLPAMPGMMPSEAARIDPMNQVIVAKVPKRTCKKWTTTGSRIPKKKCFTEHELDMMRFEAQYLFRALYDGTSNLTY